MHMFGGREFERLKKRKIAEIRLKVNILNPLKKKKREIKRLSLVPLVPKSTFSAFSTTATFVMRLNVVFPENDLFLVLIARVKNNH